VDPLLTVENLVLGYQTPHGSLPALAGVSFSLLPGQVFGLVGESGCGKSTLALSLLRLLPPNAHMVSGECFFHSSSGLVNLVASSEKQMASVRWKQISMIFQAAMNAFNPVYRVGEQIMEALRKHFPHQSHAKNREKVAQLFEMVGLEPERMQQFPHQFSGGMKQRAMIAMALSCEPSLVIADEPTTALDVIVQHRILAGLKKIQRLKNTSMIYVSHDMAVVSQMSDRIAVMYAGKIVECGPAAVLSANPSHPYSHVLMGAFPDIHGPKKPLKSLGGEPPDPFRLPSGCAFHPRCPFSQERCAKEEPVPVALSPDHVVSCHFPLERKEGYP